MECKFFVGQKVVCAVDYSPLKFLFSLEILPILNKTYTIRAINNVDNQIGILLEEIHNPQREYATGFHEVHFDAEDFKPLTDISIFKEMLNKTPTKELVDVD